MIDYAPAELAGGKGGRDCSAVPSYGVRAFPEPGSGSDLASLTTRATPRRYGLSNCRRSGPASPSSRPDASCSLAPRRAMTESPHSSTWTPGITIRPLRTMHGVDEFCEVYYDDVVIRPSRMLGRPGDGWRLAMEICCPTQRSSCSPADRLPVLTDCDGTHRRSERPRRTR